MFRWMRPARTRAGGGRRLYRLRIRLHPERVGRQVTQYYRGAQILRGFDDEARGHVSRRHARAGIDIHCGTSVMRLERAGKAASAR
jgi:hypothetical protein